jgi:hypothetical protein
LKTSTGANAASPSEGHHDSVTSSESLPSYPSQQPSRQAGM